MRYARYAIFLSAIMIATGIFLPYLQLGVGGYSFGKSSSMTLYGTVNNYTFLEAATAKVDVSMAERITDGILARAGTKSGPLSRKLRDAKSTIRDIRQVREDAHIETLGTVLRTTGFAFLGILFIVSWLVLKSLSAGMHNRRRGIVVTVLMTLVSIVSAALFIAAREAIREGNAELGAPMLSMGSGAYMMLIGAACGFIASGYALYSEIKATAKPKG